MKGLWVGAILIAFAVGCRPYEEPKYVEADSNDTVFVIPIEGDTTKQQSMKSVDYLNLHKVAAKRIRVTRRWFQKGHYPWQGEYIDDVLVIKVSRAAVSREWTVTNKNGSSVKDQAIWVESKDSIGFALGFMANGLIQEADTALFCYWYPSQSLADVMDGEVRARICKFAFEACAKEKLDLLRTQKNAIMKLIENGEVLEGGKPLHDGVIAYFKQRGITIQSIGFKGGFQYENPKIQEAIDQTFMAQQESVSEIAVYEGQLKENERIIKEVDALSDRLVVEAVGKANGIRSLAAAAKKAGEENSMFFDLQRLEVDGALIDRWDGKYPEFMFTGDSGILPKGVDRNVSTRPVK